MPKTVKKSALEAFGGLDAADAAETPQAKYATREQWLNAFVALSTPFYAAQGLTMPDKIRVSIGWPSSGIRSKTIGECWIREASGDGFAEIFVSPALKETARIAGVLTHELVHAIVGHDAKHGPVFRKAAVAMGLEGKMTATTEGAAWHAWADGVLEELGPYPGNVITGVIAGGKKKQGTRMIKGSCPVCEFTMRLTRKWIDEAEGTIYCPMPSHMTCEEVDGDPEDEDGPTDSNGAEARCTHDGTRLVIEESEGEGE